MTAFHYLILSTHTGIFNDPSCRLSDFPFQRTIGRSGHRDTIQLESIYD
jgi:hypothetical protein